MLRIVGIITLFILLFTTCERPLDLDLDSDGPQYVVISNFSNLDTFEVVITKARSALSQEDFEYFGEATVRVFENNESALKEQLIYTPSTGDNTTIPGHYRGSFIPEAGVNYRIRVLIPGFENITAENLLPERVDFNASNETITRTISSTRLENSKIEYNIPVNIFDQQGEDFYQVNLYQEFQDITIVGDDTLFFSNLESKALPFRPQDNGVAVVPYIENKGMLLDDQNFDAFTTFDLDGSIEFDPKSEYPRRLLIEVRNVSSDYYKYHTSLTRQFQSRLDPQADQVVVFNNIREGGFGIFAGFNSNIQYIDF